MECFLGNIIVYSNMVIFNVNIMEHIMEHLMGMLKYHAIS